ncbi:transcriptional regulator [Sphingobacterium mizutaii NBRC 14946 = DSM 11724]|uniref:Morphology and auto-aggregation control protein n=2 Tax=Sphingobacterium mizutaii TaxID=1010 RepID=A0AAJ5C0D9_9SPHI|nr:hydrogen peroxide-inducible genes activator [Sphingobacterium mizutaii]GEM67454.1 transcriptional regulator [Sphingobacterium mizutaii NBRC 14946 = DSM 11724]SDL05803.1 LysR family transcriptional regulator, hydrogen peroxide-inducible genes activator [Sphingobacterium mizutaii]SNV50842.1 Morphology and auto-aggregation control protein [Sphingobacterium mizutaii]
MTLVQLEYIIAVDTYRSFVAAAEKCFVTQPTLSMQIQKLEESLGVKIFDRSRQPVVPTEIGEKIIEQARTVLTESKKISEILQAERGELAGDLKIGVIPTVAPYLLPNVISNFMKKYNKLKLQIWEYTTEQIIQELKIGTLDCGILSTPLHDPSIQEIPLFYETFVAYVSDKSSVYEKKMINIEDISSEKLWLLNEGHCMRGQVLNICNYKHNQSKEGTFDYNTGSVETLKRMVDLNGGLTILPEMSISNYDEDQLAHVRYFRNPEPVREISLVTPQNYVKKHAINMLKNEILNIVPEKFKTKRKKEVMGFSL